MPPVWTVAPGDRVLDAVVDELDRRCRDERADDRLGIQRISGRQGLGARDELLEELVVAAARDDDLACVEADLALVEEGPERRSAHGVVHVDIVEDQHRVVATELEHGALERAPGPLREDLRGLDAADQVDDAHFAPAEHLVGDPRRRARRMRYDVDHAGREAGLLGDLGDQQPGIHGRELGWLDDDRVARSDRRERGTPREDVRAVHGVKLTTTPSGRRTPTEWVPGTFDCSTSPLGR